jgi:hypothetical protein
MKTIGLAAAAIAALGTSGCAALLGAGAGAAAATCLPDDVDCVEEVREAADDI